MKNQDNIDSNPALMGDVAFELMKKGFISLGTDNFGGRFKLRPSVEDQDEEGEIVAISISNNQVNVLNTSTPLTTAQAKLVEVLERNNWEYTLLSEADE